MCAEGGLWRNKESGSGVGFFRLSALRVSKRGPVDADGMAVMPNAAQHRLDHIAVAQKATPFVISEIRGDDGWFSPITFFHEFEKDIGLLGFEI